MAKTTKKKARGTVKGKKKRTAKTARKRRVSGGAGRKAGPAPKPVRTGRGDTPGQVGAALVEMYNRAQFREIERRFWSPRIVSVEGEGMEMAWSGRKAVEAKNQWWVERHTIHSTSAEGPYVGAGGFAVKFFMDVEEKETGKRTRMEEVGVYTVQNGKIIREEFMYRRPPSQGPERVRPRPEPALASIH